MKGNPLNGRDPYLEENKPVHDLKIRILEGPGGKLGETGKHGLVGDENTNPAGEHASNPVADLGNSNLGGNDTLQAGPSDVPETTKRKRLFGEISNRSRTDMGIELVAIQTKKKRVAKRAFECYVDNMETMKLLDEAELVFRTMEEEKSKPYPRYSYKKQPELSEYKRAIIIDSMMRIHHKFRLEPPVLFLAIRIFDEFLSRMQLSRSSMRLVVTTCIKLAAKYENVRAPRCSSISEYINGTFSLEEFCGMEKMILNTINFQLHFPEPTFFIEAFLCDIDVGTSSMKNILIYHSLFLMESSHLDLETMAFSVVELVLGSLMIGIAHEEVLEAIQDFKRLVSRLGLKMLDISRCARALINSNSKFSSKFKETEGPDSTKHLSTCRRKYSSRRYFRVALTKYCFKSLLVFA